MQLLEQRDKKLIDVARLVGSEFDAAFSKAFKRVVGANTGEYIKRRLEGRGNVGMAEGLKRRIRLRPVLGVRMSLDSYQADAHCRSHLPQQVPRRFAAIPKE